jgi:hypothetical protein
MEAGTTRKKKSICEILSWPSVMFKDTSFGFSFCIGEQSDITSTLFVD